MNSRKITGIRIAALTSALPSGIADAEFFANLYGEKEAARVARGTGIRSVRFAEGSTTTELVVAAGNHLLGNLPGKRSEIDGLIVVTQTPDDWSPGTAFAVHQMLELGTRCLTLDINAGCAGYVNGLIQATSLVASGACSNVLLCTGDVNTRLIDDRDYQVRMLFGNAASATLVSSGADALQFIYGTDSSGRSLLGVPMTYEKSANVSAALHSLKMDGAAVMSFALRRVPEVLNVLLAEMGAKKGDIDLFALHQPNEFILNYIRNILDIDRENLPADVDGVGNTNSSSIPLLLSRRDWKKNGRRNVVLCGFGVGLSWNALQLNLSNTEIFPPIQFGKSVLA